MRWFLLVSALAVCSVRSVAAQASPPTVADSTAVRRAAMDYIEGWYSADSARMRRAVHPQLAKRIVVPAAEGQRLSSMGADALVQGTHQATGERVPARERTADFKILSLDGGMASVRLISLEFVDYLHLARVDGQWKIVNVLWDFRADRRPTQKFE